MLYFGAAYYPEHRDPSRWEHDLDNMVAAGVNCLRVGEFAWVLFEPSEGVYDFAWMDDFKRKASARGIRLLLCPPLRTLPAWMVERDPTVRIEDEKGTILEFGSRYSFCINHPWVRERGAALARALAEHYGQDPDVAGWHLDNEHGDEPDCHCPLCRHKFQSWCEAKYQQIDRLNEAWGMVFWGLNFQHFGQIPTTRQTKAFHSPGHSLDWRRFRSDCTVEGVRLQARAVRALAMPQQFLTTNNQTLWNPRTDYYDMAQELDITGTNYYPSYGEHSRDPALALANVRCYKPGANGFQVHELRCGAHAIPGYPENTPEPGEVARLTMHCLANGAKGIFYFRWRACPFGCEQHHGTITGYDGERLSIFPEVARVGNWLRGAGAVLDKTAVRSEIGLLFDFPTRWIMETGVYWNGPQRMFVNQCKEAYAGIRSLGCDCDTLEAAGDFTRYKILVVTSLGALTDDIANRLCDFVRGGGTLIWHPFCGMKDATARIYPGRLHPALRELLGVDINRFATIDEKTSTPFRWNGVDYDGRLFCDLPPQLPAGATAEATFTAGFYARTPALIKRACGKGTVWYLTTFSTQTFYADFFARLLPAAGIALPLAQRPQPEVEVCTQIGDGVRLTFLVNHSPRPQTVSVAGEWNDIYNNCTGCDTLTLAPHATAVLTSV